MCNYMVLNKLNEIVQIRDDGPDRLASLCNDTTHEPMILQKPEYEPAFNGDNTEYDSNNEELYNIDD